MARLLIADDNEAIRDILTIAATAAGHETIMAADGEAAWQKFAAGNIRQTFPSASGRMPEND